MEHADDWDENVAVQENVANIGVVRAQRTDLIVRMETNIHTGAFNSSAYQSESLFENALVLEWLFKQQNNNRNDALLND